MDYKILANKWRPKSFDQVIGNKNIIRILINGLNLNRIHQVWLLSGTRGVGKTTIGRILAKNLNCEKGITAIACGQCNNCIDIEKGKFLDFIELDAASRTKIEDIKILLETAKYEPIKGRFKIYLIDEIHMLSRYSFNALLKTLEEPPKYIKFILATTNPKKIPKTILSRCLWLHLKKIKDKEIYKKLKYILKKEKILTSSKTIKILSEVSYGSMRDALNITELLISSSLNNKIYEKNVSKLLGILTEEKIFLIAKNLILGNIKTVFNVLQESEENGIENLNIIFSLIKFFHKISILKIIPELSYNNNLYLSDYEKEINILKKSISFTNIQICYKILINGQKYLKYLPNSKIGIEMIFLEIYKKLK